MSVAYKLPAVLDFRAAAPLRESLLAAQATTAADQGGERGQE